MTKDEQKKGQNKPPGNNRESKCDLEKLDNESCNSEVPFPYQLQRAVISVFPSSRIRPRTNKNLVIRMGHLAIS
jgi:hypothetical protein